MKRILSTIILTAICYVTQAQVIITNEADPTPTNGSVLLEFGNENKGIILPSVESVTGTPAEGTFVVDTTVGAVRVYENGDWKNLTDAGEVVEHTFVNTGTADVGEGVIIGATTSVHDGILVLESTTKALVLPKVNKPEENIQSPIAGTMVYDTESNTLSVYDGANWSYWK